MTQGLRGIKFASCPLYPRKRTLELNRAMSALCQKRTHALQQIEPLLLQETANFGQQLRGLKSFGTSHTITRPCVFGFTTERKVKASAVHLVARYWRALISSGRGLLLSAISTMRLK